MYSKNWCGRFKEVGYCTTDTIDLRNIEKSFLLKKACALLRYNRNVTKYWHRTWRCRITRLCRDIWVAYAGYVRRHISNSNFRDCLSSFTWSIPYPTVKQVVLLAWRFVLLRRLDALVIRFQIFENNATKRADKWNERNVSLTHWQPEELTRALVCGLLRPSTANSTSSIYGSFSLQAAFSHDA